MILCIFFFNDTATTEIYTLSLHDALPILPGAYAKFGISFEYGSLEDRIKAIETGIVLDVYYKKVPIMAKIDTKNNYDPNNRLFLSFYISIHYGKKW